MERKHKVFSTIAGLSVALLGMIISSRGVHDSFLFHIKSANTENSITLSSKNKYNNEGTKNITIDHGGYNVQFSYSGCTTLSNGHVKINANGTIANDTQITSITALVPTFTTSGSGKLEFKASFDKKTWGEYELNPKSFTAK